MCIYVCTVLTYSVVPCTYIINNLTLKRNKSDEEQNENSTK